MELLCTALAETRAHFLATRTSLSATVDTQWIHDAYRPIEERLYNEGRIVVAIVVQAHQSLFSDGENSLSDGVVIYSESDVGEKNAARLWEIALQLGQQKTQLGQSHDTELAPIAEALHHSVFGALRQTLPSSLWLKKSAVFIARSYVYRDRLPAPYLGIGWYPILVCPEVTPAHTILPIEHWSESLKKLWLAMARPPLAPLPREVHQLGDFALDPMRITPEAAAEARAFQEGSLVRWFLRPFVRIDPKSNALEYRVVIDTVQEKDDVVTLCEGVEIAVDAYNQPLCAGRTIRLMKNELETAFCVTDDLSKS
jgi:Fe-S cluster assembly iron-binding protein IscA